MLQGTRQSGQKANPTEVDWFTVIKGGEHSTAEGEESQRAGVGDGTWWVIAEVGQDPESSRMGVQTCKNQHREAKSPATP